MNLPSIFNPITRKASGVTFAAQEHAPTLGLFGGLIVIGGAAILLAKAHKKSDEVLEEAAVRVAHQEVLIQQTEDELGITLTQRQRAVALAPSYAKAVADMSKLYGPAVLLGGLGVLMVVGGHRIQAKRLRGIAGALMIAQQSFEQYRRRVVAAYGEDVDVQMLHGMHTEKFTFSFEDEDGETKKSKIEANAPNEEDFNPAMYGRLYGPENPLWNPMQSVNQLHLYGIEEILNEELRRRGVVLLNTFYQLAGFGETDYGAVVGWSLRANPESNVDLGLNSPENNDPRRTTWIINPNVDGTVFQYIGK